MIQGGVSVITPVRNGAADIEATVLAVAQQRMRVHEHLVIDDGSQDATSEVVKRLCESWLHLRYHYQPQRGAGPARNLGIEAATGRYIAFLDSDDLWLPGKLEAQIGFMQREQVAFSYGDYEVRERGSQAVLRKHIAPERVSYKDLLNGCPIGCLTAAYDQQVLGKVYMPHTVRGQDWGLWLALTRLSGPARKYPGLHAIYHTGGGSLSANKFAKARDIYSIYRRQERLGICRASWHLLHHSLNAILK